MGNLLFTLEQVYECTQIPIHAYSYDGKELVYSSNTEKTEDFISDAIKDTLLSSLKEYHQPVIKFENEIFGYGITKASDTTAVIAGPVQIASISERELKLFANKHHIPFENLSIMHSTLRQFASVLSLLHFIFSGEHLKPNNIRLLPDINFDSLNVQKKDFTRYQMDTTESGITRLTYQREFLYIEQIRNGDVETIQNTAYTPEDLDKLGKFASNSTKRFEYMTCSAVVIATRAAIDGGVDPATAYSISDLYLQRLENCFSSNDYITLIINMKIAFATAVKETRERRTKTSYVEKCKMYIANHLNKPFTLDELAEEMCLNKAYLSRKFKSETNMSIMRYTRMKRIEAAKNMLKYSHESISTISSYLCFPSQSHFTVVFKEFTDMTPQKYRNIEQQF